MGNLVAKALVALLSRLVTEKFFAKVIVQSLNAIAKSTENKLDDEWVKATAEALGVDLPK